MDHNILLINPLFRQVITNYLSFSTIIVNFFCLFICAEGHYWFPLSVALVETLASPVNTLSNNQHSVKSFWFKLNQRFKNIPRHLPKFPRGQ